VRGPIRRPFTRSRPPIPSTPWRRATVEFAEDPDRSFFAELLAPYGHTLETFSAQAAEDRLVVIFKPIHIRAA
jgi:hypothetical protein